MKTEFQQVAHIKDVGAMPVKPVAEYAFKKLGKKSAAIPGWHNRLSFYYLGKILPRRWMSFLLGKLMLQLKES
jgi:hypothetical protein